MTDERVIDVRDLTFSFPRTHVLQGTTFSVPRGAVYALLGPNGAGKSTLLHILMGLRRSYRGTAGILGREASHLGVADRQAIGYVAEGQRLPGWMRLDQLEAYLAPWYPTWDPALANELRERFALDGAARIATFSRGQYMKAALLCALAPRPAVLLLDEPFTGMDVSVKDELVRGLLAASSANECTVLIASHDVGELELLADWVGFLHRGEMRLSEPLASVQHRFKHVDVMVDGTIDERQLRPEWMSVERAGRRLQFIVSHIGADVETAVVRRQFPHATRVVTREATLKELFLALQHAAPPLSGTPQLLGRAS